MISAIYDLAKSAGANRVMKGVRIEHVVGDPSLGEEKDFSRGVAIVQAALSALTTPITEATVFDSVRSARVADGEELG